MDTTDAVETVADAAPELDLTKTIIVALAITAVAAGAFYVKSRLRKGTVLQLVTDDNIVDAEIVDPDEE